MEVIGVDVARVRGLYPSLAARTAQLDGSYAALQPESVIRAVISTLRSAPAQPGSRSPRSERSATRALRARRAVADLVLGRAEDVLLAGSTAALLHHCTAALSADWRLGDEIVLNRLDSDVLTRPLLEAARRVGVVVRWAEVDLDTGTVPDWQYDDLIGARTRLVTVALGNPATGTSSGITAIARRADQRGALVLADAGVAPLYAALDLAELGADLLAVSAPIFGGPTLAALVLRPGLLDEFDPPIASGTLPIELLDGLTAAIDHLADLDEDAEGTRRDRLVESINASGEYCRRLYRRLDAGLRDIPGVTVLGAAERPFPVAAFTVQGYSADEVGRFLARNDVSVWTGPSDRTELLHAYGADELGGAAFLGVMPHTTDTEVDLLLDALRKR